ncbi:hypothetical protein Calkr_0288 [Caldicellulosiruptor acetigenus I77R1B]|uniref:Uncharacterized protein n=2 Tax=Caldicellulosiruptor TaxID=44000 RepID=E4S7K7_CALA7|nr:MULTISPECIES: hypothetical protein [Caldicellulosiruptor]ADQ39852.1 hypothetical protein Calkr_0288 [Caldicellulosiruptor acetigenus I77R1B]WAM34932.1 hypothetical protein OTK00_001200 [Caldicellulosiruptor morganii]
MVNESLLKKGYFVELNSYEMEFVNGGLDKAVRGFTLVKELYEFAKELYDFGRGFIKGWQDATR